VNTLTVLTLIEVSFLMWLTHVTDLVMRQFSSPFPSAQLK